MTLKTDERGRILANWDALLRACAEEHRDWPSERGECPCGAYGAPAGCCLMLAELIEIIRAVDTSALPDRQRDVVETVRTALGVKKDVVQD